jgi:hypothetical protein
MNSKWLAFIVILALTASVSAWSDLADRYFCETAVRNAWGQNLVLQCLGRLNMVGQGAICNALGEKKADCDALGSPIHPAIIPNKIGEGSVPQAGACQITKTPESNYLCAKGNDALQRGRALLEASVAQDDVCMRVYLFCTASNYIAQSYDPYNIITNEDNTCREVATRKIDFALVGNQTKWGSKETCNFDYNLSVGGGNVPRTYSSDIVVSDLLIQSIVQNLSTEAKYLKSKPTSKVTSTSTTSTLAPAINSELSCESDSDCMLVPTDCCDCSMGGKNKAISVAYNGTWRQEYTKKCSGTEVACLAVVSNDPSCSSTASCINKECALKAQEPVTTTTTTLLVPETTVTSTTRAPRRTTTTTAQIEAPTTTTLAETESSSTNAILIVVGVLVLFGGAYVMYSLLQNGEEAPKQEQRRRGLGGLGSGKDTKIESYGPSRLADADFSPRTRVTTSKETKVEKKPQPQQPAESLFKDEKKDSSDKKKMKSMLQPQEKEGSTLGRR